jgi:hypothetical protein
MTIEMLLIFFTKFICSHNYMNELIDYKKYCFDETVFQQRKKLIINS